MSNEQEFNPLEGWTKEQIKSVLKANTKTTLLKSAIQWRVLAEQLQMQLNDLHKAEHSEDPQDDTYDNSEAGTSVED
jgi:hypothetical protein|tara:strand:+ start:115 stop:345 length:231 start_codon:yes stop_codon:yes gene_type:complete